MKIDNETKQRVIREATAHDSDNVLENSYKLKDRFSHIWSYPSRNEMQKHIDDLLNYMTGKQVLDYGCGWGDESFKYLSAGAYVDGIDISNKHVDSAKIKAETLGYDDDRFKFTVMDAHHLEFEDNRFDFIIGHGILHHLNQHIALLEIYRVLNKGGRAIFFEPLADNPLLKLFRILTPSARTEDERPLTKNDLMKYKTIASWDVEYVFCGLLEAPLAMFTSVIMPNRPDNFILNVGSKFEQFFRQRHMLDSWNQYVLIKFTKTEIG